MISDEPGASRRIAEFASSDRRWLVSVLMVSEGVDIPRLRVGVYATAARTELFFRQVVGRFIRATPQPRRQMSYLLMPADPRLKALAREIELERRHALDLSPLGEEEEGEETDEGPEQRKPGEGFAVLSSGDAELDEAIMSETTLQLFPTDDPKPRRRRRSLARPEASSEDIEPERESAYAARERLRNERRRLVGDVARRTNKSHREVQARINRATRTRSVSSATIDQLDAATRSCAASVGVTRLGARGPEIGSARAEAVMLKPRQPGPANEHIERSCEVVASWTNIRPEQGTERSRPMRLGWRCVSVPKSMITSKGRRRTGCGGRRRRRAAPWTRARRDSPPPRPAAPVDVEPHQQSGAAQPIDDLQRDSRPNPTSRIACRWVPSARTIAGISIGDCRLSAPPRWGRLVLARHRFRPVSLLTIGG